MRSDYVCCGIVTFNPDPQLLNKVIHSVINQVSHIFIWDNNSADIQYLKRMCNQKGITLLSSSRNEGIAFALNRICERALEEGYEWILTLDHDTIISQDYINNIVITSENNIGIICPCVEFVGTNVILKNKSQERYDIVPACMTSGSVMSLKAWENAGKFDEWMFIDSVDNDICYKLRNNNYKIIRDNSLNIIHNLGHPILKRVLLFKYFDYQYSPIRIYYIVRNRIFITYKYWKLNGLRFILASFKILFQTFLSSIGDKSRLLSFKKGLIDGITAIMPLMR